MADLRSAVVRGSTAGALEIAAILSRGGVHVTLVEPDPTTAARVIDFLGRMDRGVRVSPVTLEDADLQISPIGEGLEASLSFVSSCSTARMRFYAPTHIRKLVEISADTVTGERAAMALARQLGCFPIPLPDWDISIGQRLARRLEATLEELLMEGGIPFEIDEALVADGWPIGPFEAQDLVGLEIASGARAEQGDKTHLVGDRMVAEGRLGKKVGVGWYRYPGGGGAVIDPLVEDLIREEAHFAGITPRDLPGAEVVDRLRTALLKEALALRQGGIAEDKAMISLVAHHGLGLPEDWLNP